MDELDYQIRRVVPAEGLCGAAWETYSRKSNGDPVWENACFSSVPALIAALRRYPSALSVKNLYYPHAAFKAADSSRRSNPPKLDRHIRNLHSTKTLPIDGDVKQGAFVSTADCKQTICGVLAEIGLAPSFIVLTSAPLDPARPVATSGMHIHLVMTRAPSLEDRKEMARDLVAILDHRGIVFDAGVTNDPVRVLRPVGSLNRKRDEVRIARLDLESVDGPDYDPDELKAILARHRPPGRAHNNPPTDGTHVDLAEVASAADYLLDHGYYGPGRYFNLRDLFFGLAQLAHERDDIRDDIRSLFERVAVATGRDRDHALTWFDGAVERAPDYAVQSRVTLASTFKAAYAAGWSPFTEEQRAAFERGRGQVRGIFESMLPRKEVEIRAATAIERERDPRVRAALGNSVAAHLARRGWPDATIISALSLASRRRVEHLPNWLDRFRSST